MELLLLKGVVEISTSSKYALYGCYGFSTVLITPTIIIFLLNLDQLGSPNSRHNFPRKKPSVILYSTLMAIQIVLQLFIISFVSKLRFSINSRTCIGLLICIIYFSFLFFSMYCALLLRAFRSIKYALQVRSEGKVHWRYCFVFIIPTVVMIIIIIECYFHKEEWSCNMFDRGYVKCLILIFHGSTILLGVLVFLAITVISYQAMCQLNLSFQDMLKRFSEANRLRNIIVMTVILSVLFALSLHFAITDGLDSSLIMVDSVLRVLMGLYFILLEFWFFDKELKKPFLWQRQKEVRDNAQKRRDVEKLQMVERASVSNDMPSCSNVPNHNVENPIE